jgi:uncharacterized surface protein with fasciclin (FAS1) repeats
MVSMGPYSESYNYTHMFNIPDIRGNNNDIVPCKNSLLDFLYQNEEFSKFRSILKKARMEGIYNATQADCTLFVPMNKHLYISDDDIQSMDISLARHIIRNSTLNKKIPYKLLISSNCSYFNTRDSPNRILLTYIHGKCVINNNIHFVKPDIECTNGLIHVVSELIYPEHTI